MKDKTLTLGPLLEYQKPLYAFKLVNSFFSHFQLGLTSVTAVLTLYKFSVTETTNITVSVFQTL